MTSTNFGKPAALAGLIFAVAFVAGVLFIASGDAETNEEYVRYFSDSGNQLKTVLGFYGLVVSAIAFVVFVVGVRARLLAASPAGSTPAPASAPA